MESKYQAFVSYSHDSDAKFAAALQSSLSRFAKPWYRLRTMRIFRDETSLAANPALWLSIEQALGESEYFLLLACHSSANSHWVQQEVGWWLRNRSVEKLLIALTEGAIVWDEKTRDFDRGSTTAIPLCLQGAFPAEPLYADFRAARASQSYRHSDAAYRSALLDIAAPLSGRSKDDLDGQDLRLHRMAQRTAGAVTLFMVLLALTAGIGMSKACQRQKTAVSRALASAAASHLDDKSELALLLSLEARRIADTVESRRSLLAALQGLSQVDGFLFGHNDAVTQAVFSPDGRTILSVGWDDRVVLWSVSTHRAMGKPMEGPKAAVSVAFSPDGSRFASAGNGLIVIWDAGSQQPVGEPFKYADEQFTHVAFSSSGKMLAASTAAYGGHPARVVLWDVATHQLVGQPIEGSTFAFSPDDTRLAIAQYESLALYDVQSRRVVNKNRAGHAKNISTLAFRRDGAVVASGSEDGTVMLWDVKSQKRIGPFPGHASQVTVLLFDRTGAVLFSGGADGNIIRWNSEISRWNSEKLERMDTPVTNLKAFISALFLSPDGEVTSLACQKNEVEVVNVNNDPPLGRRIRAPDAGSSNVAFSPDGQVLASSGEFGDVVEWDVAHGAHVGDPFSGHDRQVSSLAYAPDGKSLVSGSMDGRVIFWSRDTHAPIGLPVRAFDSPVWSLAWSPDGKTVVAGGDAELIFWEAATHNPMRSPVAVPKDRIWALAFSPDGRFLASEGNDRVVEIWKAGTQAPPFKTLASSVAGHYESLTPAGLSFSPGGAFLATSTLENSITIWNLKSGQPLLPLLYGHTQSVSALDFARDGKMLASGSDDGEIRLWDVETHQPIGFLPGQQKAIKSVAFSPKGGLLASADEDGSIIFWEVDNQAWTSRACGIANRNLTRAEWDTYLGNRPYRKTCPNL
jgi:WD40 repeat protein